MYIVVLFPSLYTGYWIWSIEIRFPAPRWARVSKPIAEGELYIAETIRYIGPTIYCFESGTLHQVKSVRNYRIRQLMTYHTYLWLITQKIQILSKNFIIGSIFLSRTDCNLICAYLCRDRQSWLSPNEAGATYTTSWEVIWVIAGWTRQGGAWYALLAIAFHVHLPSFVTAKVKWQPTR